MTQSPAPDAFSPESAPLATTRRARWAARARAAAVHLLLSAVVAGLCAALVLGVWYPTPYREIAGGRDLFLLIVSVDLVLGPLITFAIFDRRKPWRELRRDLAIVGLLQLAGLGFGMHTVWQARPVYLVFEVDRFKVVRAIDIDDADLPQAIPSLQTLPRFGPGIIMARPPALQGEVLASIESAMAGRDINTQPKTWHPYEEAKASVLKRLKPLKALRDAEPARAAEVDAAVRDTGLPLEKLGYLPLIARRDHWIVLVDNESARVVGYLPFGGF